MKKILVTVRKVFFVLFIAFAVSNLAFGGWLQDPGRLAREQISGRKDHLSNGIQELGQKAGVLVQYEIVITNRTDQALNYRFDGQPSLIPPHAMTRWEVKNVKYTIPIKFDNAHQQLIKYDVGAGHYIFDYRQGVFRSYDKGIALKPDSVYR